MRIAAGIMMMIVGFAQAATVTNLVELFEFDILYVVGFFWLLSMGLTWGGGVCAFRKKAYGWALAGAVWSIIGALALSITSVLTGPYPYPVYPILPGTVIFYGIFIVMSILALIFLVKREGEFEGGKKNKSE